MLDGCEIPKMHCESLFSYVDFDLLLEEDFNRGD